MILHAILPVGSIKSDCVLFMGSEISFTLILQHVNILNYFKIYVQFNIFFQLHYIVALLESHMTPSIVHFFVTHLFSNRYMY